MLSGQTFALGANTIEDEEIRHNKHIYERRNFI